MVRRPERQGSLHGKDLIVPRRGAQQRQETVLVRCSAPGAEGGELQPALALSPKREGEEQRVGDDRTRIGALDHDRQAPLDPIERAPTS
jgi:hypothetical protein